MRITSTNYYPNFQTLPPKPDNQQMSQEEEVVPQGKLSGGGKGNGKGGCNFCLKHEEYSDSSGNRSENLEISGGCGINCCCCC